MRSFLRSFSVAACRCARPPVAHATQMQLIACAPRNRMYETEIAATTTANQKRTQRTRRRNAKVFTAATAPTSISTVRPVPGPARECDTRTATPRTPRRNANTARTSPERFDHLLSNAQSPTRPPAPLARTSPPHGGRARRATLAVF